tara:strand:- start:153 stop:644 length:492 start_codon:yes stop_codon:yes gene_type:complete
MIATDLHADTRRIIDLLASEPRGNTITLGAISKSIGRDIGRCRHLLYSAIRVIERDNGLVFSCIRGKGYKVMPSEDISRVGQTARARIRRTARRSIRTLEAGLAGANDISNEAKKKVLAEQSALALVEHLTREKNLPVMPESETRPLPAATTAKAFLQAIGAV